VALWAFNAATPASALDQGSSVVFNRLWTHAPPQIAMTAKAAGTLRYEVDRFP